eukprot:m.269516 g.269516  ORF g.269516 m.269516 type:complete len:500 (-) comp22821_c9_seq3:33-1532(-)
MQRSQGQQHHSRGRRGRGQGRGGALRRLQQQRGAGLRLPYTLPPQPRAEAEAEAEAGKWRLNWVDYQQPDAAVRARMTRNNAGGLGFAVTDLQRLHRFLVLGSEGGTYYTSQQQLGLENMQCVLRLIGAGRGGEVVEAVRHFSVEGRTPKQQPLLLVLAVCARLAPDEAVRRAAFLAVPAVCRTPTMLFMFLGFAKAMGESGGWGRLCRRAVATWYTSKSPRDLAYTCTKYANREGWTHRDVLRLAHVKPDTPTRNVLFQYLTKGYEQVQPLLAADAVAAVEELQPLAEFLTSVELAKTSVDDALVCQLVAQHHLAREHINTQLLGSSRPVWQQLLQHMPLTALMRNLGKLSSLGMFLRPADVAAAGQHCREQASQWPKSGGGRARGRARAAARRAIADGEDEEEEEENKVGDSQKSDSIAQAAPAAADPRALAQAGAICEVYPEEDTPPLTPPRSDPLCADPVALARAGAICEYESDLSDVQEAVRLELQDAVNETDS